MSAKPPESSSSPLPEEPIAHRYKLEEILGRGGQAVTYRARDITTDQTVAIKVMNIAQISEWKQFELFQRECAVLKKLEHPGIPRYIDDFQDEAQGAYYLVMEYIPGQSLKQWIATHGVLDEKELWQVLIEVLQVLAYLHDRNPPIIHRDIKPSNLIHTDTGDIMLVDFGGVRTVFRADGGSTVVGTFGYMAPEQLHGQATPATDLYSLGATLIHLGSGVEIEDLPRKGLKIDYAGHLKVTDRFRRILDTIIEPNPEERPTSANELLDSLDDSEAAEIDALPKTDTAPQTLPGPWSHLPGPVGIVVSLLLFGISIFGYVALAAISEIIIPLFYLALGRFSPRAERPALEAQKKQAQQKLRQARQTLSQLSLRGKIEFQHHSRKLEQRGRPGRGLHRGRLPRRRGRK